MLSVTKQGYLDSRRWNWKQKSRRKRRETKSGGTVLCFPVPTEIAPFKITGLILWSYPRGSYIVVISGGGRETGVDLINYWNFLTFRVKFHFIYSIIMTIFVTIWVSAERSDPSSLGSATWGLQKPASGLNASHIFYIKLNCAVVKFKRYMRFGNGLFCWEIVITRAVANITQ